MIESELKADPQYKANDQGDSKSYKEIKLKQQQVSLMLMEILVI